MAIPPFPQPKESQLLQWSTNFDAAITATPVTFGLTAAQATAYNVLHTAFATAYAVANNATTNSKANVNAKNVAKEALLYGPGGAWELVNIIQAFPGTTDAMRGDLNIKMLDNEPTPVPAPTVAPDLSIIATMGRVIRVRLRDQQRSDSRGKPSGVTGATVLYHVSEALPPNDPTVWTFALNTSKTLFDVEIPQGVAAGSKVWLTAFWFNQRKDASPAATFESTRISDQLAQAA